MGKIDWKKIAEQAREKTNKEFREEMANLVRLNDNDIERVMKESNIDSERFSEVMRLVNDSTLTNNKKAKAIEQIDNGLRMLIGIVERLV